MSDLIHQFIAHSAQPAPAAVVFLFKEQCLDYAGLQREVAAPAWRPGRRQPRHVAST